MASDVFSQRAEWQLRLLVEFCRLLTAGKPAQKYPYLTPSSGTEDRALSDTMIVICLRKGFEHGAASG